MRKLIYTILSVLIPFPLLAQDISPDQTIPMDPSVRIGKLENGLTYYISHCDNPQNRAEFYIVHNVGAMQEDDNQNGLAHFLEHMAFNGTKHFPKKSMLEYLSGIGVRFGANVNAFTSRNVTAYNISEVPLVRESIMDTVLLMLHDWSSHITCDSAEIEGERGVIREEWRTGDIPRARLSNQQAPVIYNHSKFAQRNVIGDINIIMNFKQQTLLDFYHKWYRPDLQAVIVVGDFDVDLMEKKIKNILSDLPKAKNPTAKETYIVPDNKEPLVGLSTDPDAAAMVVRLMYKLDEPNLTEKQKVSGYKTTLERTIVADLLKNRLTAKVTKGNAYIRQSAANYTDLTPEKKTLSIMGAVKNNNVSEALNELSIEVERIKKYGFTQEEFNEVQANLLKSVKLEVTKIKSQKSADIVKACMNHFTTGSPVIPNDFYEKMATSVIKEMTVGELNDAASLIFSDDNIIILVIGPKKENISYPSDKELIAVVRNAGKQDITPHVHQVIKNKELITKKPVAGSILNEQKDAILGTVEWTLSNGAKVIIKSYPTTKGMIDFYAYSKGGTSILADDELPSGYMTNSVSKLMGAGKFSQPTLKLINAGKVISIKPEINEFYETLSGNTADKDVETFMQMLYLYITEPRFNEKEYNLIYEKIKNTSLNREGHAQTEYSNEVLSAKYDNHPRKSKMTLEKINMISFDKCKQIYSERFGNAGDFTFIFTGNIDPDKFKPMAEKYIASLPSTGERQGYKDNNIRYHKGKIVRHIEKELTTDKASVNVLYTAQIPYTTDNQLRTAVFSYILRDRYMKSIREEKGGTYSVSVNAEQNSIPTNMITIDIAFETAPSMVHELLEIVQKEVDDLTKNGPSQAELENAQRYFDKLFKTGITTNSYWLDILKNYYQHGIDTFTNYEQKMNSITSTDIRKFAKTVFGQKNKMEFVLQPKK